MHFYDRRVRNQVDTLTPAFCHRYCFGTFLYCNYKFKDLDYASVKRISKIYASAMREGMMNAQEIALMLDRLISKLQSFDLLRKEEVCGMLKIVV